MEGKNAPMIVNYECAKVLNSGAFKNVEAEFIPSKVLVIGSCGDSARQAILDCSTSQAIKALMKEGIKVILMKPKTTAEVSEEGSSCRTYFLPITFHYIVEIISSEKPNGILLTFGGQTALNLALELNKKGVFKIYGVRVLGTSLQNLEIMEGRQLFARHMEFLEEPCIPRITVKSVNQACKAAEKLQHPIIIRTECSLFFELSNNKKQTSDIACSALKFNKQIVIEKFLNGWRKIQYIILRDAYGKCITVCNMENINGYGTRTHDSITVCPAQTLNIEEESMLKTAALKVVDYLQIIGEFSIQFALDNDSPRYYIIKARAGPSSNSALASKATGCPIQYNAAKLSLALRRCSIPLIHSPITSPSPTGRMDCCAIQIRWGFDKTDRGSNKIGMAIGIRFEEAFQKALRMADETVMGFDPYLRKFDRKELIEPSKNQIFAVAHAIKQGNVELLSDLTKINSFFLKKFENIISYYTILETNRIPPSSLVGENLYHHAIENIVTRADLLGAKQLGFSDRQIANIAGSTENIIRHLRQGYGLRGYVKRVNSMVGGWPLSNSCYITHNALAHDIEFGQISGSTSRGRDLRVIVLGSGGGLGSNVEFDWCVVKCLNELKKLDYKTILINNNPVTISTDYDVCHRLYMEEISYEAVMDIHDLENPCEIIMSIGAQVSNGIAMSLHQQGARILGFLPEWMDIADDKLKFNYLLDKIYTLQPLRTESTTLEAAREICENKICVDAVAQKGKLLCVAVSEQEDIAFEAATYTTPPQNINSETMAEILRICSAIAHTLEINGPFNTQLIAKGNQIRLIECNLRVSRLVPFVSRSLGVEMVSLATQVVVGVQMPLPDKVQALAGRGVIGLTITPFSLCRLSVDYRMGFNMAITSEVTCFGRHKHGAFIKALLAANVVDESLLNSDSIHFPVQCRPLNCLICGFNEHTLKPALRCGKKGFKFYGTQDAAGFYAEGEITIKPIEWMPSEELQQNAHRSLRPLTRGLKRGFLPDQSESVVNRFSTLGDYVHNTNKFDLIIDLPMREPGASDFSKWMITEEGLKVRKGTGANGRSRNISLISNVNCAKLIIESLASIINSVNTVVIDKELLTNQNFLPLDNETDSEGIPFINYITVSPLLKMQIDVDCLPSRKLIRLPGFIDLGQNFPKPSVLKDVTCAALAGGITMVFLAAPFLSARALAKYLRNVKARCDYALFLEVKHIHKKKKNNAKSPINTTNSDFSNDSNFDTSDEYYDSETDKSATPSSLNIRGKSTSTSQHDNYSPKNLRRGSPRRTSVSQLTPQISAYKMQFNSVIGLASNPGFMFLMNFFKGDNNNTTLPIFCHAKQISTWNVIRLAENFGRRFHISHVSLRWEIEMIKEAKIKYWTKHSNSTTGETKGLGLISCDVCVHHLFLNADNRSKSMDRNTGRSDAHNAMYHDISRHFKADLPQSDDVQALWENLDYIDCFATDHTSQTIGKKLRSLKAPPVNFSLKTMLPLMLTALDEGKLTISQITEKCHTNALRIINLPEQSHTYIEVDMDQSWTIPDTISAYTEYRDLTLTPTDKSAGRRVRGKLERVVLRGKVAYLNGNVIGNSSEGRFIVPAPAIDSITRLSSISPGEHLHH